MIVFMYDDFLNRPARNAPNILPNIHRKNSVMFQLSKLMIYIHTCRRFEKSTYTG